MFTKTHDPFANGWLTWHKTFNTLESILLSKPISSGLFD